MLEITLMLCTAPIVIWLWRITERLDGIAASLRQIAATRSTEIGITVPGNKEVKIELPDGRVATKEGNHE